MARSGRGGGAAAGNSGRRSRVNPRPSFPPASVNGIGTCHRFNSTKGCDRRMLDATTCADPASGQKFVHFCDYYDMTSGQHCLLAHSKPQGNH